METVSNKCLSIYVYTKNNFQQYKMHVVKQYLIISISFSIDTWFWTTEKYQE